MAVKLNMTDERLYPGHLEKVPFFRVDSPLLQHSKNVTSQFGEDGIVEAIFTTLKTERGYCIEFGASDGISLSNTYNLLVTKNWSGLLIEPSANAYKSLVETYKGYERVTCLNSLIEIEGDSSLDSLLAKVDTPVDLELISIDVDGLDYYIWESLVTYRPKIVLIEFNPSIPNDVIFVQAKSFKVHQGCSLAALVDLGKSKGYELICATVTNAFFVVSELFSLFNLRSNHITSLYTPARDGRIFHGYDSTIFTVGMPSLIWSGVDVQSEDLQVLPQSMRRYHGALKK